MPHESARDAWRVERSAPGFVAGGNGWDRITRQGSLPQSPRCAGIRLHAGSGATLAVGGKSDRPQVAVRQLLVARIESGVVRYEATFHFDVRYTAVKSLRIDVPATLAGEIRNVTQGIRDQVTEPRPEDVAEEYTSWTFTGEREFLGDVVIKLTWEQRSRELPIGGSVDYPLPWLKPMGVDRAWGQNRDCEGGNHGCQCQVRVDRFAAPVDPQHDLAGNPSIPEAALAFEFHEDWSLAVTATRYELEDVKRTSIERAVVRMVVTRSGNISVQALYRVRSAVQRLLVELPPDRKFDTEPLRINGRSVSLEIGDQDRLFIPMVQQSPDQPFVLELRYTVPAKFVSPSSVTSLASTCFGKPVTARYPDLSRETPIQSEPAIQKIYLLVQVPDDLAVVGAEGPWTNEQLGWYERLDGSTPGPDARALVDWVTQGIALQSNPFDSFPTDGRLYVYSTLHPDPFPTGSLRLVAWHQRWLNLAIFGGLAMVGLVFAGRPMKTKVGVLALVVTAAVLVGVFAPTFTMRILDFKLVLAVGLVVLLWLAQAAQIYIVLAQYQVAAVHRRLRPSLPPHRRLTRLLLTQRRLRAMFRLEMRYRHQGALTPVCRGLRKDRIAVQATIGKEAQTMISQFPRHRWAYRLTCWRHPQGWLAISALLLSFVLVGPRAAQAQQGAYARTEVRESREQGSPDSRNLRAIRRSPCIARRREPACLFDPQRV